MTKMFAGASRYHHPPEAYIASICLSGCGSQIDHHLCSAVADFNSVVPRDKALQVNSLLSAIKDSYLACSPVGQPEVSRVGMAILSDLSAQYTYLNGSGSV